MAPLLDLQPPTNVSELRRVLGLFVQLNHYVPNYAVIAKPLTKLQGNAAWRWTEVEQEAFEALKKMTCARPTLAAPDFERRFYVDTDASEDGHGWMLYHQGEDGIKHPVSFGSKAWKTNSILNKPIYYKEGVALFHAIDAVRYYIETSPFTTVVRTDHKPLLYIHHTHRGLLTDWLVEKCAGLDYRIEYIEGPTNVCADAFSRAPFVQRPLVTPGLDKLLETVLERAQGMQTAANIWVWADRDTLRAARTVQQWRIPKNPIMKNASTEAAISSNDWHGAIILPSGEAAPGVCANLLQTNKPFACLCPSDLVDWVPLADCTSLPITEDHEVAAKMKQVTKLALLSAGLTWLVFHPNNSPQNEVLATRVAEAKDDKQEELPVDDKRDCKMQSTDHKEVGDLRADWIPEQKEELELLKQGAPTDADVLQMDSGLWVCLKENETAKILVPLARRKALTILTHTNMHHRSWKKVLAKLRNGYFWPNMATQVKKWVQNCTECPLVHCRRNLQHNQFSSVVYEGPRTAYAFDFYGVAKSDEGHQWVLTVIDLFSREVQFLPLKTRTASETLRNLLEQVINTAGVPAVFVSDEAPEFMGKIMAGLCAALGIKHVTTKGCTTRRATQLASLSIRTWASA